MGFWETGMERKSFLTLCWPHYNMKIGLRSSHCISVGVSKKIRLVLKGGAGWPTLRPPAHLRAYSAGLTIADLTIQRAGTHPIHVTTGSGDTLNTLIYNVHLIDPAQQAIKINPNPGGYYPDNGVIACSHLELTDAGRPHVDNPTLSIIRS